MSRSGLYLIILACALLIGGSIALWAAVNNGDDDEQVPLSKVPKVVLDAAKGAVSGDEVEIVSVEKESEDGEDTYDVEMVVDGVAYEVEVTARGEVKEVEKEDDGEDDDEDRDVDDDADDEDEQEVPLSEVPTEVIEAAKNVTVSGGNITAVEKESEDGEDVYDVEMVIKYEVEVTPDGVVKEVEKEGDDEDDADDD